eukprot:638527-Amorphochlora_amoeboformis.AAC.1
MGSFHSATRRSNHQLKSGMNQNSFGSPDRPQTADILIDSSSGMVVSKNTAEKENLRMQVKVALMQGKLNPRRIISPSSSQMHEESATESASTSRPVTGDTEDRRDSARDARVARSSRHQNR